MDYFMLIASPVYYSVCGRMLAIDVLRYHFSRKVWPFYEYTRHKRNIKKGDRLLFYLAGMGTDAQTYVAHALAESDVGGAKVRLPAEWHTPRVCYGLALGEIQYLDKPVPIRNILSKLSFIHTSKKWGAYMQGGCSQITKQDFDLIMRYSRTDFVHQNKDLIAVKP